MFSREQNNEENVFGYLLGLINLGYIDGQVLISLFP